MSEPTPQDTGAAQQNAPRLSVQSQYIKDLSFENPRAPQGLAAGAPRPEIQVGVDVKAQQTGEGQYEVVLQLNLTAKAGETSVFVLELSYGGVFSAANIPQDSLQPLVLIECPRLLFPFARRVIADLTRDGGFPPIMLDPIDFVALYRRRVAQTQTQTQTQTQAQNGEGGGGTEPSGAA